MVEDCPARSGVNHYPDLDSVYPDLYYRVIALIPNPLHLNSNQCLHLLCFKQKGRSF